MYETEADRIAERKLIEEVCEVIRRKRTAMGNVGDYTACKLSPAYGLDWALAFGRDVYSFCETKVRKLSFNYEDGYYISALKVMAAKRLKACFGLPCTLVVRFDDGIARWASFDAIDYDLDHHRVILAGRRDRGGEYDIEPHQIVEWRDFDELENF